MTSIPSTTPIPPTPTIPPTWMEAAPGFELRTMTLPIADDKTAETVITRIDPSLYTLRIHYDSANPKQVSAWRESLGALAAINAGFFQEDYSTAGLIVADGQAQGTSFDQISARYYEFSGMLTISDSVLQLRYLAAQPYVPGESIDYGVQGLPMLITSESGFVDFDLPPRPSRRTAVAHDAAGRLLLITVSNDAVTLYELRDWLSTNPELNITAALNLDGGPSTGLAVNAGSVTFIQESWSNVPSVLAVYPLQTNP